MFKFLFIQNFFKKNKIFSLILNSKITFIFLIIIILAQFVLTGIIFFQNRKNQYLVEQANFQTSAGLSQIKQLNEKINSMQSYIMRINAQMYRMQDENQENN